MPKAMRVASSFAALVAAACLGLLGAGCRKDADEERRASLRATADAEERAQEASLTSASLAKEQAEQSDDDALREGGEVVAAFRLERSDYRLRLQRALDELDTAIERSKHPPRAAGEGRLRDLQQRRDLLKSDLDAVARSVEPDWATLRTKVERDLETGRPGAPLLPRTDRTSGEP